MEVVTYGFKEGLDGLLKEYKRPPNQRERKTETETGKEKRGRGREGKGERNVPSFLWKTKPPKQKNPPNKNPLNRRLPLSRPSPSRPPAPRGRVRDVSHCGHGHRRDASRRCLTWVQLCEMCAVGPPLQETAFKVSAGQGAVFINTEGGGFAVSYSRVS